MVTSAYYKIPCSILIYNYKIELFGTMGPQSHSFVRSLGRRICLYTGDENAGSYLMQCLSVACCAAWECSPYCGRAAFYFIFLTFLFNAIFSHSLCVIYCYLHLFFLFFLLPLSLSLAPSVSPPPLFLSLPLFPATLIVTNHYMNTRTHTIR